MRILIAGAGKIGTAIAYILASNPDYHIYLTDFKIEQSFAHIQNPIPRLKLLDLNIEKSAAIEDFIKNNKITAVISCLPYYLTLSLASIAHQCNTHYFDLTEDVETTNQITKLSQNSKAFVSQCGLAPGLINIIAADLIQKFDQVDIVKLRCGALPQTSSHPLQYSLTWSVDGLINEYINPCPALQDGKMILKEALDDLETIQIDGHLYEAFNTSGGIGTLFQTFADRVHTLDYKSIRYPGHCEKMKFLLQALKLNENPKNLKQILLHAIPYTREDVVIIYISIHGMQKGIFTRETYVKRFYPAKLGNIQCTAIQATTASSACAVIDLVLRNPEQYQGRIKQEDFKLNDILANPFGQYLQGAK